VAINEPVAGSFPWARFGALVAVVGMTALTFVSCGPINFKGHELARNLRPQNVEEELLGPMRGLTDAMRRAHPELEVEEPVDKSESATSKGKDEPLFEGSDRWLHFADLGALAMAVLALLLGARGGATTAIGVLGLALLVAFLVGFDGKLKPDKKDERAAMSMAGAGGITLEIGAFLALGGMLLVCVDGVRSARAR
jgi:hypothetical protein